jgi:L-fuculose-phosphate aldolase
MPFSPLPHLKSELVSVAKRLHENGWVANHDGNVSVRLKGARFLLTPTAISKRDVEADTLLIVDEKGQVLEGRRQPFSEMELHLAIYRSRPEVDAVVHSHAPSATAWGLTGLDLAPVALAEAVVSLGTCIPTLPFAMPKTPVVVQQVEAAVKRTDVFLMQGNGVFSCGVDLEQALLRMELVEHLAKILFLARGSVSSLPAEALAKLLEARMKAGLGPG